MPDVTPPEGLKPGLETYRWYRKQGLPYPKQEKPKPTRKLTAPRRETAPRRSTKPTKTQVMGGIGNGIAWLQTGLLLVNPSFAEDALNNQEIAMLADALADEC